MQEDVRKRKNRNSLRSRRDFREEAIAIGQDPTDYLSCEEHVQSLSRSPEFLGHWVSRGLEFWNGRSFAILSSGKDAVAQS